MIDFLKYRIACAIFSVCFIAAFIGTYIHKTNIRGEAFSYSIDFTGGTQILLRFDKPVTSSHLLEILGKAGWPGAITREFSDREILVRVKEFSNDAKGLGDRIKQAVAAAMPDTNIEVLQSEGVGAGVGAALRSQSIYAVLISALCISIYIAFRFWSYAFALGAIMSLLHDAIFMVAIFLFFDKEISVSVIGAILAVLGYSINDTIVIFAQIRENLKKMAGQSLREIVNTSINQTLRRTLLTSAATAMTVTAMYLFGGEVLRDFSLALLVGILFGVYSTIFIASPVMMLLYKEKKA
jgi:preprotein translocase subunit SecF